MVPIVWFFLKKEWIYNGYHKFNHWTWTKPTIFSRNLCISAHLYIPHSEHEKLSVTYSSLLQQNILKRHLVCLPPSICCSGRSGSRSERKGCLFTPRVLSFPPTSTHSQTFCNPDRGDALTSTHPAPSSDTLFSDQFSPKLGPNLQVLVTSWYLSYDPNEWPPQTTRPTLAWPVDALLRQPYYVLCVNTNDPRALQDAHVPLLTWRKFLVSPVRINNTDSSYLCTPSRFSSSAPWRERWAEMLLPWTTYSKGDHYCMVGEDYSLLKRYLASLLLTYY